MRTRRRSVLAAVAAVGLIAGGCSTSDDGRVRLTSPPCDDEGACAEAYEFEGRIYTIGNTDLTDEEVAEFESERHEVAEPEGIGILVTTDDANVIYLHETDDERWLRGHATE